MDLDKKFGFDDELAAGQWVAIGDDGTELKLAIWGNARFERFLEPHRQKCRVVGDSVPESVYEEAMAKHILLDWKGVEDQGLMVEPTEPNRLAMLRAYGGFKALVIAESSKIANFQRSVDEAEIKN